MSRDLVILRHGARLDAIDKNWLKTAGHTRREDSPLSPEGEQQAELAAQRLVREFAGSQEDQPTIEHIICSPFERCIQTALPVAKLLGKRLKIEPGIIEHLSRKPRTLSMEEVFDKYGAEHFDPEFTPEVTLESLRKEPQLEDAQRRAGDCSKALRKRFDGCLLLVTHSGAASGMAIAWTGEVLFPGLCSVTHIHISGDGDGHAEFKLAGDLAHISTRRQNENIICGVS